MKIRQAAAAAIAATGVYAQDGYSFSTSGTVSYLTVTYDDCPSASMETMITVTNGVTVTYCPECEMGGPSATPTPGYTTIYTTTYLSLCPTGMTPVTYTVTESCTEATPTWTPGPDHIPQGYTVATKPCTVCGEATPTVTVTEPCGCEAHEGVPVTPTATATSGGAGRAGSGATPTGSSSSGGSSPGGSSGGSSTPECNGEDCGSSSNGSSGGSSPAAPGSSPAGGAPPYPTPSTTTPCAGPQCRAAASSYPSGVTFGNTTGIVPSMGAASDRISAALPVSLVMAVVIAGFAFAL